MSTGRFAKIGKYCVCDVCRYHEPNLNLCGTEHKCPGSNQKLGDYTESLLQSVGITKERYIAAKQLFGLAPTCGCGERKEWLNRVSDWWRGERS